MALADHVVVMNLGRIEDEGAPERIYARPATRFSATFMGESTILEGVTRGGKISTALGEFAAPDGTTHVAIRPEHVALGGDLSAVIVDVAYQGSFKRAQLRVKDELLLARLPSDVGLQIGRVISIGIDAKHVIPLRD